MKKTTRGFTLLLAVLISSILIALGGAIFDIVSKQILLSSAGRESQFAFYAADTGIECALYWDSKGAFSSTSPITQINCGDTPMSTTDTPPTFKRDPGTVANNYTLNAELYFRYPSGSTPLCVTVLVNRTYSPTLKTTIQSFGHNTCDNTSSLLLERAIKVTY